MKLLYTYKIYYLLLVLFSFQKYDYQKIEDETLSLQHKNKFKEAQENLFLYLQDDQATYEDKAKVLLLIANTYRSLNDYPSCIKYQRKAMEIATQNTVSDSLIAKIRAENSFTYFDSHAYQKSDSIMHIIQDEQYANQEPINKAYLIMQKGYLHFLNKEWNLSDLAYKASLSLLKKHAICHSAVVEVKQIELLCSKNRIAEAENIYEKVIQKADSCHIIKYKIYATEQLIKGLIQQDNITNIKKYNQDLAKYNKIYNREKELREVHETEFDFLQKEQQKSKNQSRTEKIFFLSIIILLALFCIWFLVRYFKSKKSYQQLNKEIKQMRKELQTYAISLQNHDIEKNEEKYQVKNSTQKVNRETKLGDLTERQQEIFELIIKGYSNKKISEELCISESTVKYHIKNIYNVLGLKNRKEAIVKYA